MSRYKINTSYVCIQIPVNTDEYLRKFYLDNSFMRLDNV